MDKGNRQRRALIMAGGTGGHVIPALSLAKALQAHGVEVHWLGTPRGLENTLVPQAELPLHHINVVGLRGKGVLGWLKAPFRLLRAINQARKIIDKLDPGLVIGMGGFASGPGGLAAWLMKRPLVIHEQNAVAGMTNKMLARFAARVYAAFPSAFPAERGVEVVGNPVRDEIALVGQPPRSAQQMRGRPLRLLVVGGSLGAKALNDCVPQALALLPEDLRPEVRHQAGRDKDAATRERYAAASINAEISAFIDDMAAAYDWADLIVCRSGALTVAELAAAAKPSILVPFPFAVDDHQRTNARYLTDADAARLLPQNEMSAAYLADMLKALLNPETLAAMAIRARGKARLDAMDIMAAGCMEIGFAY
ncbi:undecaprenyldiphospho-muramoylpentapeptide beta-N-acetylglucosaminyltransferase [Phytohalomonas tamaricis]|uniref:undecaprenyldiphospho-muramoylpentapeptide beta-N-acetylglucosaminyltransferase n=1 Tax=Phytohalomonas tamaricis TaxID=2081032 RepID=UPI0021D46F9B|nr:undecaprenyldiphospho-muramoylpentapeptide beta-N-acetylglucosaminyltransferase [Phytohalomonas tamaricis]